jgi:cysteine-rich repeat protein
MFRSLPLTLAVLLAACGPQSDTAEPVDLFDTMAGERLAPPPLPVTMTATPFVSGSTLTIRVTGQPPGTVMNLIVGTNIAAPGLCPPPIAPTCLDLSAGFTNLGTATTNAAGVAQFVINTPAALPPRAEFQAYGARAGTYYLSNSVLLTSYVGTADADNDGLSNAQEIQAGTDLLNPDTDGDGLNDGGERAAGTDPRDPDSDDDGLADGGELNAGTNPLNPDTDADGLSDGQEVSFGTDPLSADTDGDGISDAAEVGGGTDPLNADTDADGLSDGAELSGGTDPLNADTDADGLSDGAELALGTDPLLFDTDGDGLGDDEGSAYGTDPLNPDTDGGSVSDGAEVSNGTNPLDAGDDVGGSCGDSGVDPGEDCDDGNNLDGDTCPSNCLYPSELEPNNDGATATGPFLPPLSIQSSIDPIGDYDWYTFTVPATADVRIETSENYLGGVCASADTLIDLYASTNLTSPIATDDDDSPFGLCSLLQPSADAAVRQMAPGTYYLRVHEYQDNGVVPSVFVNITFDALCGDGQVTGSEECDGGPTCGMDCQRIQTCGDGFLDAPETCDDGNTASGDGCSALCVIEGVVGEIEPNDSATSADATGIVLTSSTIVSGAATPATDRDLFRVEAGPTARVATFETFENANANDCVSAAFTTAMFLQNAAGTSLTADSSVATAGIRSCSALSWTLDASTPYYIALEESGRNATLASWYMRAEFPPGIGAEAEPNENLASATPLVGASGWIAGGHQASADLDWYSITVPAGHSLRLETIEGDRAVETCESNGIDSKITLFNSAGTQLGSDDDGGRGFCSIVDGTGTTATHTWARALPAGTYFIQVNSAVAAGAASQFDYKLIWKIRTP